MTQAQLEAHITARQAVSIQNTEQQTKGDEKETDNKNKGET